MNPVIDRLMEERRLWRQDTPKGFSANPMKDTFGNINLFKWECEVPGPRRTSLEARNYKFTIEFDKERLKSPLKIFCTSNVTHPNISHSSGYVCSSLNYIWPECCLKQILFALQSFLESPYRWRHPAPYPNKRRDVQNLNEMAAKLTSGGGDVEKIRID